MKCNRSRKTPFLCWLNVPCSELINWLWSGEFSVASGVGENLLVIAHIVSFQVFSPFCNLCNGLEIMGNAKKQATRVSYWTVSVGMVEAIVCLTFRHRASSI